MVQTLRSTVLVTRVLILSSLRSRVSLFFTFVFPLLFVFGFGFIFGQGDPERMEYIAAQLLVIIVISAGLFGLGNLLLLIRQKGVLKRLHLAPVSRHAVLFGVLAAWGFINSLTFFLMVSVLDGVFGTHLFSRVLPLWGLYLVEAWAISGVAFILAMVVDRAEGLAMAANALFFPMLFLSGLTIPSFLMPDWLQSVGRLLPSTAMFDLTYGLIRGSMSGGLTLVHITTLLLMGAGGYLAAQAVYRWGPEQRIPRTRRVQIAGALLLVMLIPWGGIMLGTGVERVRLWFAPRYVLVVAGLFDGEQFTNAGPYYIGIEGDNLGFVGPRPDPAWAGVKRIDYSKSWVLPPLADLHVHLEAPAVPVFDPTIAVAERMRHDLIQGYLASGVMRIRSFGDGVARLQEYRRLERSGLAPYPFIEYSGPIFTAPGGHPLELPGFRFMSEKARKRRIIEVATPAAARRRVEELVQNARPDWIKAVYDDGDPSYQTYPRMKREVLAALIETAHKLGVRVTVHVGSVQEMRTIAELGADMVEHLPMDAVIDEATLRLLGERDVVVCPTVFVEEQILRQWQEPRGVDQFTRQRLYPALRKAQSFAFSLLDFVPEMYRDLVKKQIQKQNQARWEILHTNLRLLHARGIRLVTGSDAGNPGVFHGPGLIDEVVAMVHAGLPVTAALRAATANVGTLTGGKWGRIRRGYPALLVILGASPRDRIENLKTVTALVYKGRLMRVDQLLAGTEGS